MDGGSNVPKQSWKENGLKGEASAQEVTILSDFAHV